MNRVLRQDATLAVAWLRWAPWLGLAAGCLAGIGLLVGSDALTSVALVPVAILVVAFLVVWLGVLVGLVLAFVGRGRVPNPWMFPVQLVRLAYRQDTTQPQH